MARAAHALAGHIADLVKGRSTATIFLLVGSGNNGGDALFAGAELAAQGLTVVAAPMSERVHDEGREAFVRAGGRMLPPDDDIGAVASAALAADVIADAILGTGTSADPALRGRAREVVAAILDGLSRRQPGDRPRIVAVDVPSGIEPTDGRVPDPVVLPAELTVTFGACKTGLLLEPAVTYAGRVVVADIGLQEELDRLDASR